MYSPDESVGRRRNWASVYTIMAATGIAVLIPEFTPQQLSISNWLVYVWAGFLIVGFGQAAFAAFSGRKLVWMENTGVWLGCAGISIYTIASYQSVFAEGLLTRLPSTLGYTALAVILVSRAFRLQRHLKTERRIKEIVRIAQRNEPI